MGRTPSRGRHDPAQKHPLRVCRDDERKFYNLLDADLLGWKRRVELALVFLMISSGTQLSKALGLTAPPPAEIVAAVFHLARSAL